MLDELTASEAPERGDFTGNRVLHELITFEKLLALKQVHQKMEEEGVTEMDLSRFKRLAATNPPTLDAEEANIKIFTALKHRNTDKLSVPLFGFALGAFEKMFLQTKLPSLASPMKKYEKMSTGPAVELDSDSDEGEDIVVQEASVVKSRLENELGEVLNALQLLNEKIVALGTPHSNQDSIADIVEQNKRIIRELSSMVKNSDKYIRQLESIVDGANFKGKIYEANLMSLENDLKRKEEIIATLGRENEYFTGKTDELDKLTVKLDRMSELLKAKEREIESLERENDRLEKALKVEKSRVKEMENAGAKNNMSKVNLSLVESLPIVNKSNSMKLSKGKSAMEASKVEDRDMEFYDLQCRIEGLEARILELTEENERLRKDFFTVKERSAGEMKDNSWVANVAANSKYINSSENIVKMLELLNLSDIPSKKPRISEEKDSRQIMSTMLNSVPIADGKVVLQKEHRTSEKDYLNLTANVALMLGLRSRKDSSTGDIFSDYVVRINSKEERKKRILLITTNFMYNLSTDRMKVIRRIDLRKIYKITLCQRKCSLFVVHVDGEYDYLLESHRRAEIILFLAACLQRTGADLFHCEYRPSFSIKNRRAKLEKLLEEYNIKNLTLQQQGIFRRAQKLGYLRVWEKGVFTDSWKELFAILSDVGLLLFSKMNELKPRRLIPIHGAMLQVKPASSPNQNRYPFVFRVHFPDIPGVEHTFACPSQVELDEWVRCIERLKAKDKDAPR
eukprot:TRINITY_DN7703_c0_g1_i4.p1 TRINITY_DN7703_c0_g1~~TRINITY_DN7703_c0_g1_i4.p1  ORF type:complete len:739 (-),score=174.76 TRINITY_DN7703_c0_g1_i4:103-2319(-)